MINTLIFGFDGTIAQTLPLVLRTYNELAGQYHLAPIDDNYLHLEKVRSQGLEQLMKESQVNVLQIPLLAIQIRQVIHQHIASIPPVRGLSPVLAHLQQQGFTLGILTSNEESIVREYLLAHQLSMFSLVKSETNIWGKGRAIRKLLKEQPTLAPHCVYVGDKVRDALACQENKLPMIGVTWGFNNEFALRQAGCQWLAFEPEDISELIKMI